MLATSGRRGKNPDPHGKPVRDADRIRACELLLEYGWGKPPEFSAIAGTNPLERDEVAEAIAGLVKELRQPRAQ